RRHHRNARVHGAGTGDRRQGRAGVRPLLPGHDRVRDAHRRHPLRRRGVDGAPLRPGPPRATRTELAQPLARPAGRRGDQAGAGQGPRHAMGVVLGVRGCTGRRTPFPRDAATPRGQDDGDGSGPCLDRADRERGCCRAGCRTGPAEAKGEVSRNMPVPRDIALGDHVVKICWKNVCHAQTGLRVVSSVAAASPTAVANTSPGATPTAGSTPRPSSTPTAGATPTSGSTPHPTSTPTSGPTSTPTSVPQPTPSPTPTQN